MKKNLKDYHQKRNFEKTLEPSGKKIIKKIKSSKARKLQFVVQEHHASHLHFDFRLELDGVLKSWAIPKGPSMNPEDKRLAFEVEDHPLEYVKFHGTIPKGEYGAGKVYIWDKGTYEVKGDPHAGLKNGKLEFSLKGKKLKGFFVLLRLQDQKKGKHNWLLIKMHDEKKTTVKNWPGFIEPQLALLVDHPPTEAHYVHEIKFDGYRLQAQIRNGRTKLFTRNGHDWSDKFPSLIKSFNELNLDNVILDGEAVVIDKNGKTDFGLLHLALSNSTDEEIKIFLFDLFYYNGQDLRDLSLRERKDQLKTIIPKKHHSLFYSEDVDQEAESFFQLSCKHHLEGIISKDSSAPYQKGRSRVWCKSKCSQRQEMVIGGYTTGKGNRSAELGALLLGVYDKNKFRYVGKVGTGFNRQTLRELKDLVKELEQSKSAFDLNTPTGKEIHWLKPKLVAEVNFSEWTSDKSLRHPVFIGLRDDKDSKEIVEEVEVHIENDEQSVKFTHPEKIIYKNEKITKSIIVDYYREVSDLFLQFSKDRPLSLVRCPNGSSQKCFYQKHPGLGQTLNLLKKFKVKEKSKSTTYTALENFLGLKQLVQMNALEIHVWNTHYQKLMSPDQVVLDFDPDPSVSFKAVVSAVKEMKKILDKLKLKSFVKTTGGKGLHIHIPIAAIYTWDEVRAFARALADIMVENAPDKYIATMSKEKRKGKIFIDYLRNGFGATAIAPYSLRARALSSVAMPLEWSELASLKSSDFFTLKKALLKIKSRKKDPWEKINSLEQKIPLYSK